jgi:signal peptidase I
LDNIPKGSLLIDGQPISNLDYYTVEQDYYWAMGDNRDDSLDSRFWGFVPRSYILGEALFSYFSLNLETWIPRFDRIGTILQ